MQDAEFLNGQDGGAFTEPKHGVFKGGFTK